MKQQDFFSSAVNNLALPNAEVRYYPDFIEHEEALFEQLVTEICWQQDTLEMYGKPIPIPRLNAWYGDAGADYSYSGIYLRPLVWTPLLSSLKANVESFLNSRFNSMLANFYRDQNDSVAWHSDDEKELGYQPLIASLSFGQSRRFSLRHKSDPALNTVHMELEGGSLLVMAGETQSHWQHQVAKLTAPCEGRVNLTFRHVSCGNP